MRCAARSTKARFMQPHVFIKPALDQCISLCCLQHAHLDLISRSIGTNSAATFIASVGLGWKLPRVADHFRGSLPRPALGCFSVRCSDRAARNSLQACIGGSPAPGLITTGTGAKCSGRRRPSCLAELAGAAPICWLQLHAGCAAIAAPGLYCFVADQCCGFTKRRGLCRSPALLQHFKSWLSSGTSKSSSQLTLICLLCSESHPSAACGCRAAPS